MNRRILKSSFLLGFSFFLAGVGWSQSPPPSAWQAQFRGLVASMPRLEAEKEIERIRQVKSTHELYAMDTSAWGAYRLDDETILLVEYKPGTLAARVTNGAGGRSPVDGTLIEHQILRLR